MNTSIIFMMALSALTLSSSVHATVHHKLDDILSSATAFAEQHYTFDGSMGDLEISVNEPDSRIRVPLCSVPLDAFWPYDPGNQRTVSVGVKCNGQQRWKLYLQAELKQFKNIVVLNTPVRSGDVLDAAMVSTRKINILDLRSPAISDISKYLGMKFTRSLQSGTPLSRSILEVPAIIKRGDYINIISGKGLVEVAAKGFALADGYLNDTIKVRNVDSKKVIQALVVDAGFVRILR